ncbi:MAG TPA: thiol reductant ABC exporter subunit CydD [Bosea sp. (in: a-proteobacteria)]|jgi:ATP-binding cassette subfamily C protein CydD|uniref:thiol reductant ABC exporter subunit CydD n=1 Tax=Bosea sp. (in: a-proteobacteria) TaxID=1871050 RepID=UPI002E1659B5|nr:thiol reductant ABC exporter subunit CydD [Bosea sp. (in: a-proteobacteria)]
MTVAAESLPAEIAGDRGSRVAMLMQTAGALFWLPQAGLIAFIIGGIAEGRGFREALLPAAGVLALGVVRTTFEALGARKAFLAARASLSRRRGHAVAALAAGSPLDRARPASGQAASVVTEQAEALVSYLARFGPARFKAMVVPLVILGAVLPLSWVAALVLLLAAPLIPIFMALIGWRAKAASEAQLAETGNLNGFLLDRLRGLATIRALGAVDATALRLRANAEDLRARTMTVLRIAFLSSAVLELFSALGVALAAVYVGFHLLDALPFGAWGEKLSLGEGLFILLLAPAFFEPLRELSAVWHDRAAGQAAIAALDDVSRGGLALVGGAQADREGGAVASGAVDLRIEGLRFCHAGSGEAVLDGFDLRVAAGEHVAILGPSGSGKTTLLALVAGLAPADNGEISVGGTRLGPESAAGLRRRMAWIGQRPHLFAATLAGNISLGRPEADAQGVTEALRIVALDGLAAARPGAAIGEGGAGLSGGEGLRLALARGAANPRAGLILADEPTAHLDAGTARAITERLLAFAAGRTLVVATHDPVLAARMDRVIRLDLERLEGAA